MRHIGYTEVIAIHEVPSGRVVLKVDAVVQAHQKRIRIYFPDDIARKHEIVVIREGNLEYETGEGHASGEGVCFDCETHHACHYENSESSSNDTRP